MTCSPILICLRTAAIMPALGVVPPSGRPAHSSTRSAPPRSAFTADSTESRQISSWRCPGRICGYAAAVLANHGLAPLAAEGLLKFRKVHHEAIHAIFSRRVLIGDGISAQVFRPLVLTGPLRIADEESLV